MLIIGKLLLALGVISALVVGVLLATDWQRPWRLVLLRHGIRSAALAVYAETVSELSYGPHEANRLDILIPRFGHEGARPVAIVLHGGGWASGSRHETRERVCRRYIEHGFLVVNADYRFGLREASEDAEKVLAWAFATVSRYGGDPAKIVVTGESAGGHLALLAGLRSPKPVAAVINFYGVSDLVRSGAAPINSAGGVGIDDLSPVRYAGHSQAGVLSIHGLRDSKVPVDQTETLTARLRAAGGIAEQLLLPDAGHGFSERQLNIAYRAVFEFLRRRGVSG